MRKLSTTVLLVIACLLVAAAPSGAAGGTSVIADCNSHGKLTRSYTDAELRSALSTMPADVKEYTSCADVIQRALLTQLSGSHTGGSGGRGGSSGGSFLPTWLIVLLVLLALSGLTLGAVAVRRRSASP